MRNLAARLILAAGCCALALFSAPALCLYAIPAIERVPVARLIANLQAVVDKNPNNLRAVLNLARAQGMAYALRAEKTYLPFSEFPELPNAEIQRAYPNPGGPMTESEARLREPPSTGQGWVPVYGLATPVNFDKVEKTTDPAQLKAAQGHLAQALAGYRRAAQLAPENLVVQLGLAWLTERAGNKQQAVRSYRSIVAEAWKLEQGLTKGVNYYITSEAGRYLIPLLDPVKDKAEIDSIKARTDKLKVLPRRITPIAIPLAAGLLAPDLEDLTAAVSFDAEGWGLRKSWTWITPQAAWLVYQSQPDSRVESALDWFGSVTFWLFWNNGYEALGALDDDHDGQLRAAELQGLALWRDANQNGVSEAGEIQSLAAHGIVALTYDYRIDTEHPDRIAFAPEGVQYADGSTRPSYDLILHPAKPRLRL